MFALLKIIPNSCVSVICLSLVPQGGCRASPAAKQHFWMKQQPVTPVEITSPSSMWRQKQEKCFRAPVMASGSSQQMDFVKILLFLSRNFPHPFSCTDTLILAWDVSLKVCFVLFCYSKKAILIQMRSQELHYNCWDIKSIKQTVLQRTQLKQLKQFGELFILN